MKNTLTIPFLTIALASFGPAVPQARADHEIGNGGGAWVCRETDPAATLRWAKFVDLYEGRLEFELDVPESADSAYSQVIRALTRLHAVADSTFSKAVFLETHLSLRRMVAVDAELVPVEDAFVRIRPQARDCSGGRVAYEQLANWQRDGRILVQKGIFEDPSLGETGRAALVVHEALYAIFRRDSGDRDSRRTRRIVGLLFSTLDEDSLRSELRSILDAGPV